MPAADAQPPAVQTRTLPRWVPRPDTPAPPAPPSAAPSVEGGVYPCPFGFALNVALRRTERLVPVAADSPAALAPVADALALVRASGGFEAQGVRSPTAELRLVFERVPDLGRATKRLHALSGELLALGRDALPASERDLALPTALELRAPTAHSLSVHLYADGTSSAHERLLARLADGMLPALARLVEATARSEAHFILRRRVLARCRVDLARLGAGMPHVGAAGGEREAVLQALRWLDAAQTEPVLASAQNELVLGNVVRVAQALGNDPRRILAEGHCHASRFGGALPLAGFVLDGTELVGTLELPLGIDPAQRRRDPATDLANGWMRGESLEQIGILSACLGLAAHLATVKAAISLALMGAAPERASAPPARRSSLPPPPRASTTPPPRASLPAPPLEQPAAARPHPAQPPPPRKRSHTDLEATRAMSRLDREETRAMSRSDLDETRALTRIDLDETRTMSREDLEETRAMSRDDLEERRAMSRADLEDTRAMSRSDLEETRAMSRSDLEKTRPAPWPSARAALLPPPPNTSLPPPRRRPSESGIHPANHARRSVPPPRRVPRPRERG